MVQLFVISALVASAYAGGYGGGDAVRASSGGYGGGSSGGYGGGLSGGQTVAAAIQTRHQLSYVDVPTTRNLNPATIEIGASQLPVTILFRSSSSSLNVQQAHDGNINNFILNISLNSVSFLKNQALVEALKNHQVKV